MRRLMLLAMTALASTVGFATVLYDASTGRVKPDDSPWGWFYLSLPVSAKVTGPTAPDGGVILDTSVTRKIQAGFGKMLTKPLDRRKGIQATWKMRVLKEEHDRDNQRAGLSVFVLSSDHHGIEIAFWRNRVFVYNDDKGFKPAEYAEVNTNRLHTYRLSFRGDAYDLSVDGKRALKGRLRNYSWFGFPYNRPSSVWYGDNTRRASSVSEWSFFEITG